MTEEVIRNAMKDAPLKSQQRGGISLPRVREFVDKLNAGETPPAIKVDNGMIVEGNHRYIAGRIVGKEPPFNPGQAAGRNVSSAGTRCRSATNGGSSSVAAVPLGCPRDEAADQCPTFSLAQGASVKRRGRQFEAASAWEIGLLP